MATLTGQDVEKFYQILMQGLVTSSQGTIERERYLTMLVMVLPSQAMTYIHQLAMCPYVDEDTVVTLSGDADIALLKRLNIVEYCDSNGLRLTDCGKLLWGWSREHYATLHAGNESIQT